MLEYMIIEIVKHNNHIILNNTVTDKAIKYIGYSLPAALREYRRAQGLRYKHFTYIYI